MLGLSACVVDESLNSRVCFWESHETARVVGRIRSFQISDLLDRFLRIQVKFSNEWTCDGETRGAWRSIARRELVLDVGLALARVLRHVDPARARARRPKRERLQSGNNEGSVRRRRVCRNVVFERPQSGGATFGTRPNALGAGFHDEERRVWVIGTERVFGADAGPAREEVTGVAELARLGQSRVVRTGRRELPKARTTALAFFWQISQGRDTSPSWT